MNPPRSTGWLPLLALLAASGCSGGAEVLSTPQMVERTRASSPRCQAGEVEACGVTCLNGGPNASCERACAADNGEACFRLAARLEREVDAPDAETPPTPIPSPDGVLITNAYVKACELGFGRACLGGGGRILNGEGPGKRGAAEALDLLRRGCEKLRDVDTCCGMAQLNMRLGQAAPDRADDYQQEAKKWAKLAARHGGKCPELTPTNVPPVGAGR